MATLREFILNQSTLVTGNLVRDHINNPAEGGSGGNLVLSDGLEVEMTNDCFEVEIEPSEVEVEIDEGFIVEIEMNEFEVEIC